MKNTPATRAQTGAQFLAAMLLILVAVAAMRSCGRGPGASADELDYTPSGLR